MRDNKTSVRSGGGRFDMSSSGTYRAPYKSEPVIIGIIIGAFAVLAILVILFAVNISRDTGDDSGAMMISLALEVTVAVVEAEIVMVAVVMIRLVMNGYKCSFLADEERFTTNEGGNSRTIYYEDVQAVFFVPLTILGKKVRGYEVTVKLNGRDEVYRIVSEGFMSEKSTPFYIINDRVEAVRRAQSRKRYNEEMARLASNPSPSERKDNGKRAPSSRLGQDAMMPSVSLDALSKAAPPPPADDNSDDNDREIFIDSDGRERSPSDILCQGTFKTVPERKKTIALIIATVLGVLLLVYIAQFYNPLIVFLTIPFIWVMGFFIFHGEECSYRANGREFVVTNKKGDIHIAFENAQSVNYLRTAFGYKAEILTVYGIVSFNCMDSRRKIYKTPEKLPFDIIAKNIKK